MQNTESRISEVCRLILIVNNPNKPELFKEPFLEEDPVRRLQIAEQNVNQYLDIINQLHQLRFSLEGTKILDYNRRLFKTGKRPERTPTNEVGIGVNANSF
jgi:hypothetical protein